MEIWPKVKLKPDYKKMILEAFDKYTNKERLNYRVYLQEYDPIGDYLNWGSHKKFRQSRTLKYNQKGIPIVKHGNRFYYNPVTTSQYALTMYGKYLHGESTLQTFFHCADLLLSMQSANGSLPYSFTFSYYLQELKSGWVSGMAQGQALSVFARAYHLSRQMKYLEAGNRCLKFLLTPISKGGAMDSLAHLHPSLTNYIFFEEYPITPPAYTLNGFQFTLLGLYDWWKVANKSNADYSLLAENNFKQGIQTLKNILKYYDIGGYSTYDLSHIIYNREPKIAGYYHAIHIYLLHALHSITGEKVLKDVEALWTSYFTNSLKE
jgi:hypothetical protein